MTRYYFDIRDGKAFVKDDEGMELPDIADAQIEAAEFLADVANELSMRPDNPAGHPMSIEVRDSEGPLFLLSFDFLRPKGP
jgi:hypothetical protein